MMSHLFFHGRGLDMKNVCNVPNGDELVVVFTSQCLRYKIFLDLGNTNKLTKRHMYYPIVSN